MGAETVDWAGRDIYMPPPVLQENKQKELRQQQKKNPKQVGNWKLKIHETKSGECIRSFNIKSH